MEQHFQSTGSQWTKLHKPIRVLRIIPDCVDEDEDKFTKMMMRKYGIDKVRGGTYCQIMLDDATKKFIQKELFGASNKCYGCGKPGHFVKDCPYKHGNVNKTDDHASTNNENDNNDIEDLVNELKSVRDKAMDWICAKKNTIHVKSCKTNEAQAVTVLNTDAASITYVRNEALTCFQMQGITYHIVRTKRDMGLLFPENYIVIQGLHTIPPGTHVIVIQKENPM
jgi:hypothetical protein